MWNASTFQHESQLKCCFNWLFILIFNIHIQSDEYAAYFVEPAGTLKNLIDPEFPMVSGVELDGVSDWVEDYTNEIYLIAYGSADWYHIYGYTWVFDAAVSWVRA